MIETILIATVPALATFLITRLFERKKYLTDVVSVEQTNLKTMLETYNISLESSKIEIERLTERINSSVLEMQGREKIFLEKEADYIMKIKDNNERIAKLEAKVSKLFLKVCIVKNCQKRETLPENCLNTNKNKNGKIEN